MRNIFKGSSTIYLHISSSYLRQLFRNLFHKQGFTYDYVFDWNMLKFGGHRPESEAEAKERERKHRSSGRQPSAGAAMPVGASGAVAADVAAAGAKQGASMQQQMAPPEPPFGSSQPPVVRSGRPFEPFQ